MLQQSHWHIERNAEGHLSLETLSPDAPISGDQIGARAPVTLDAADVISLAGGAEMTLGGRLRAGDVVDLLLPTSASGQPVPRLPDCVVLDIDPGRDERVLVVLMLSQRLSNVQASAVAQGKVALVRTG